MLKKEIESRVTKETVKIENIINPIDKIVYEQ